MATPNLGFPSKIYKGMIGAVDKFVPAKLQPLWQHPAGPKTVFFWAPAFKWGLVIAGLGDLQRPAEKLSLGQCGSLFATGLIWSRYSLVITPKNYSLFSVNLFVALTQLVQLVRAYNYKMTQQAKGLVIAGIGDLARPVETLSIGQSASLFATGVIWSRYSLVIIPKNYGLFSVNVFIALTQFVQLCRAYNYQRDQKVKEEGKINEAVQNN